MNNARVTLNPETVRAIFHDTDQYQGQALTEVYKLVFPNWDDIESVLGHPQCNERTWKEICRWFQDFDQVQNKKRKWNEEVMPGGAWLNTGFSCPWYSGGSARLGSDTMWGCVKEISMRIVILPSGDMEMVPDVNEVADFCAAKVCDLPSSYSWALDLLSGFLIDPMGDGKEYELVVPEEFRVGGGYAVSSGDNVWHYPDEDLFVRLQKGDTITWSKLQR